MSLLAICEMTKSTADLASVDVWRSLTAGEGGRNLYHTHTRTHMHTRAHTHTYSKKVSKKVSKLEKIDIHILQYTSNIICSINKQKP